MRSVLGIDLGTSSLKVMMLDCKEGVLGVEAEGYDTMIPQPGFGEQDPETWWQALLHCLEKLKKRFPCAYEAVQAVSFSGQMHGLVTVDKEGRAVRPAILWMDQRSEAECREIEENLTEEEQKEILQNRIFPGFAFPSLLWIRKHEQRNYQKIYKIMQPKDYLRFRLTNLIGTDVTDASATLMFDIGKRTWAWSVIEKNGLDKELFPECYESAEIQGTISAQAAVMTGLSEKVLVSYGMGDQQAQSIGNGVIEQGQVICNIGTGGQISTYSASDRFDTKLRTHTFCHCINEAYTIYGATLNGGIALKWLKNQILQEDSFQELSRQAKEVPPGSEGIIFLPYLNGERTPHMNPDAKGMFFGLTMLHDRRHMIRAVMEGITFSLKSSLDILKEMGINSERIIASGGGATSEIWLQMQADVFDKEVQVCTVSEQACLGACMIAGVASGAYENLQEAREKLVKYEEMIYTPDKECVKIYQGIYEKFVQLYQLTKDVCI